MIALRFDVAIPAFNEASAIPHALESILTSQLDGDISLNEIHVLLDGCTDATQSVVQEFCLLDRRINLVAHQERAGKNAMVNRAFAISGSDALVLMDADSVLEVKSLSALLRPIRDRRADLVGANVIPSRSHRWSVGAAARTFDARLERIYRAKKPLSFYGAYGRTLALSRGFFETVRLPMDQADDLFIYFLARHQGATFAFASDARVMFLPPESTRDYARQFARYWFYTGRAEDFFGRKNVRDDLRVRHSKLIWLGQTLQHPAEAAFWFFARIRSRALMGNSSFKSDLAKGLYSSASGSVYGSDI